MAERFLTLMADLDDASRKRLSEGDDALKKAGFVVTQTPSLPYHISMGTFPLEREAEIVGLMKEIAGKFPAIAVHFSHIGIFTGGKVLFCAPERSARLDALHDACEAKGDALRPWTPHVTALIDEPEAVCAALPVFFAILFSVCCEDRPAAFVRLLADAGHRILRAEREIEFGATGA